MTSFKKFKSVLVPEFIINKKLLLAAFIDDIKKSNEKINKWLEENDPAIIVKCKKLGGFFFSKTSLLYVLANVNESIIQVMVKEEYLYIYKAAANLCLFLSIIGFIICLVCNIMIFVHFLWNIKYYCNAQIPDYNPTSVFSSKAMLLSKKLWTVLLLLANAVVLLAAINNLVGNYIGERPMVKVGRAVRKAVEANKAASGL
jgi:hypothetical protein